MTGVVEAATVIGLISAVISIIEATKTVYTAAKDAKGQPEAFRQVAARLPLVNEILKSAKEKTQTLDESAREALKPTLESCKAKAEDLNKLFREVVRKDDDKWYDRYRKAVGTLAKGDKVECLMEGILKDIQVVVCERLMGTATDTQVKELEDAIKEMNEMPPSLPDEARSIIQTHSGSGDNIGHTGPGTMNIHKGPGDLYHNVVSGGATFGSKSINSTFINYNTSYATVAAQVSPSPYKGHYSHSSLQPVSSYVHRPALHVKLRKQIRDVQTGQAEEQRIGVVWGLGGAGKSQLVLNYIREHRQDYSAVFWVEAGSKESIERDYIQMYRLLYGRSLGVGQEILKVEEAVSAVKSWFYAREGRWLIVLDSADNIDDDRDRSYIDLRYFMPDAPRVSIIITSRSFTAQAMTIGEAVEVADMELSEGSELFQRCAKIQNPGPDIKAEVDQIVKELGCLALAITLAGLYVSVTPRISCDIRRYLSEYRQRRQELLCRRPQRQIHRYGESVLSTWEASFDAVELQSSAAARLLGVLAFMNFDDIFLRMFDRNADAVEQPTTVPLPSQTWRSFLFPEGDWSLYQLEAALEMLQRYALVQWKGDQGSYSMHKLVHAWGQDRISDREKRWETSGVALELLADATADGQMSPSYKLRLVPHLMANVSIYLGRDDRTREVTQDRLALISRIEDFLDTIGRWSEAYEVQFFHLRRTEETLGKEHPDTLASLNNLANVLSRQGKYEEAEQKHRQTLASRKKVLGEEHPATLVSMNNLAKTLSNRGKYEEAEQKHRQTLVSRKKVLGEKHPDTLTSIADLVWTCYKQGQLEEAEELGLLVKETRLRVLTEEHPDTLTSMAHLGAIYEQLERSEEAGELKKRVLDTRVRVQGREHPNTLISMVNLALTYRRLGKLKEAEDLEVEALRVREEVLGLDHPSTLTSMNNLAWTWRNQGRHEEAMSLMKRCISMSTRKLGRDHPSTQDRLRYWGNES